MLRVVNKLQKQLPLSPDQNDATGGLGDWFATRFVVNRQPYLLLVSSTSLLAAIEQAHDVRSLPRRLPSIIAIRLERLGISRAVIDAEIAAMMPVTTGPTNDRSIVGVMANYCWLVEAGDSSLRGEAFVREAEDFLWRTPMLTSSRKAEAVFPAEKAREFLDRWWSLI